MNTTKERPILFSAPMVRAILDGSKTQTRRIVKPKQLAYINEHQGFREDCNADVCPHGKPGDRLWVRETWRVGAWDTDNGAVAVDYITDGYCREEWIETDKNFSDDTFERLWKQSVQDCIKAGLEMDECDTYRWEPGQSPCRVRPSIHMPRWASRILLEITVVRVERLQDISEADAKAEGCAPSQWSCAPGLEQYSRAYREGFRDLWESINEPDSWEANPWVWVIEFKQVQP